MAGKSFFPFSFVNPCRFDKARANSPAQVLVVVNILSVFICHFSSFPFSFVKTARIDKARGDRQRKRQKNRNVIVV